MTIRTTCAFCGVGCGIAATVTGDRAVTIAGDAEHPANHGRLCSKGTHLGETLGLAGRLLHPLIGEQQVSWDRALDEIAGRLRETIAAHGPDSVACYVSGQLLTEDYYVANKLVKGFLGTANIDTNSRLCMASAVAAHVRAFGEDVVPCSYDDLDDADLIVLVGSNTAWCHPVVWQRIERAREQRGAKLVVIDPRRTETAERADLHLAVEPDGDIALFNALLAALRARGLVDDEYLARHCQVQPGFWNGLDAVPAGVPLAQFEQFVELVAACPNMLTLFSQGANQSVCGTDKGNAIINLHLATGRINRPGAGPFSLTGQPNAMGGREVGGLANMLACHLGFSEQERAAVGEFWRAPALASQPGLKAVELFEAVHSGKIKFLWVMATNPAVSMPDAEFVREALRRCPTVVVSDIIEHSDTARLAHIRLPALGWGEKDGTVTNSERRVSRQRALLPAPGEARADWRIVCDIARRLGHGEAFAYREPSEIFSEFAAMTALAGRFGKKLDLTQWAGCTSANYDRMRPFQWGGARPLARSFAHPDGRARLVAVAAPAARPVTDALPLRLNTGRYRDQWHTMTRTGLSPRLSIHRREPLLEVHPADAASHRIEHGGLARVGTAHGAAVYRVQFSDGQRRGEIFVPMHWTDLTGGASRTGALVHPATDPHSGQPGFKNVPASLAPVEAEWRAFLLSRNPVQPPALYWAQARIEGGWLTEIAADRPFESDTLLPDGERSEVVDRRRGMRRVVVAAPDGSLAAALYETRNADLPEREWMVRQFAGSSASMMEWLAARPVAPLPELGELVCVCHDVRDQAIRAAVSSGSRSVRCIGEATRAGTNCGSCRPLLERLIAAAGAAREAA